MSRFALAAVLLGVIAGPLLAPLAEIDRSAFSAWREADRIFTLLGNSAGLIAVVVVLAVPTGTCTAIALERLPVAGACVVRAVTAVGLFVPLPVYAVAWQIVLGRWLPPMQLDPGAVAWRPWEQGLVPAGIVHAAATLPWVVWIVTAVLRSTDRGLEDEAAATGGPATVARLVLRPRLTIAVMAATGWVMVQAGTEIPVTDAMMVRTFAEEVYTQLVASPAGVRSAIAITLPAWLAAIVVAGLIAPRLVRHLPPTATDPLPPLAVPRWVGVIATAGVWAGMAVVVGTPTIALIDAASVGGLGTEVGRVVQLHYWPLLSSLISAVMAGLIAAALAIVSSHAAVGCRWFAGLLLAVAVVAAVTPGPLIGLGLKSVIHLLLDVEERFVQSGPLRTVLYDSPSAVPGVWASVVRFFPLAVAVCWPAVRATPRELRETATMDGHGAFRSAVWPTCRGAFFRAAAAVAVMSLGEVSAGKLVCPPGRREYVLELFAQMHYGAEAVVAAMALVQMATTAALVSVLFTVVSDRNRYQV